MAEKKNLPLSKSLLKPTIGVTSVERADQAKEQFFHRKHFSPHRTDAAFPVCQTAALLGCG